MLIGLVSDTHGNEALLRIAVDTFRARRVDLVLHLGDITEPETLALLDGLPAQAVRGNNDFGPVAGALPETWRANLEGIRLFATHGHVARHMKEGLATSDVVLHGHTHQRRCETVDGVLVVNPGALHRAPTKSIALLSLPERRVEFLAVDERGVRPLRWS